MVIDSCSNTNRSYVILPLWTVSTFKHYNVPNYNVDYDDINTDYERNQLRIERNHLELQRSTKYHPKVYQYIPKSLGSIIGPYTVAQVDFA